MAKDTGVWVIALALGLWAWSRVAKGTTPPPTVPTTPEADISLTIK